MKNCLGFQQKWLVVGILISALFFANAGFGQTVSPLQGGHYSPAVKNIRDMATPPPGLFVLWYNTYAYSNKYIDREGNAFSSIRLDQIHPALPEIDVNLELDGFASIPSLFWASNFKLLGARYMAGVSLNFISADVSIITERGGIIIDTTYTRKFEGRNSGFSDLFVAPLGLSWAFDKADFTFLYGFAAPTGKYETGSAENLGLGFWTHQFQGYTYFYPVTDSRATAVMLGLTYELNGEIKDAEVKPGDRFSLEWGISQYLSERFELGVMGGHNWQVSDDSGEDVYWDPSFHDRKHTLAFNAGYWVWRDHLNLALKYGFDYGVRQRFKNNYWMLNIVFVPNVLTGKKREQ